MFILAALTTSELIRYSILILLIIGLFIYRIWRINLPKLFKVFSLEKNFSLKGTTHITCVQNGIEGELALMNPGTKYVKLLILARGEMKTPFEIRIMPSTWKNKFDTLVNVQLVETGDPEFDRAFLISSNDEALALSLLDYNLRADLLHNRNFLHSAITFDDSCMHMEFVPHIKKKEHLENYSELMLFLMHMVQKIEHAVVTRKAT